MIRTRQFFARKFPFPGEKTHIPDTAYESQIPDHQLPPIPEFDSKLISQLEKLSLVRFDSEQAVANLKKSVRMAQKLEIVDVKETAPMHTVWENQRCRTFADIPEPPLTIHEVFRNSAVRFDDYFVTPPGNVPLESKERFDLEVINQWDKIGKPQVPEVKKNKLAS